MDEEVACPLDRSSYSRRELPQRSDSHGAVTAWASTQRHSTKSQGHRSQVLPGPLWKRRGQWVAPGYTSPECILDGSQPPSSPDSTFAIPCGDKGTAAVPLRSPFACSFCNTATDTREGGLLGGQPAPPRSYPQQGESHLQRDIFFFPFLASIPLARTGKMNQTGKQAKGIYELFN